MDKVLNEISDSKFRELVNIRFKNIYQGFDEYCNGMLIGDNNLSLDDNEQKFINFFKECYKTNKENTYVDFYLKNLNGREILNLLEGLDEKYKIILLENVKKLNHDTVYFAIKDEELMEFITVLNTRSLFFCTVYFTNLPITIWGNYDLKFPVFFKNKEDIHKYSQIAEKYGLKIDNINL